MRLPFSIVVALTFALAGGLSLFAASFAVQTIEDNSEIVVRRALDEAGHSWAEIEADGLQVVLAGTAKDEAERFHAISVVGTQVDATRIIDKMEVAPSEALAPPRFSAEILRNDSGISIIGLVPAAMDRAALVAALRALPGAPEVNDLLETADYPAPRGWDGSVDYAVRALALLPRSKISVEAGAVTVSANSDSREEKQRLEADLTRAAPATLTVALDIAAPRPVITPFTLRFLIDETGGRFDACSADSDQARDRILAAARSAGLAGNAGCTIGMGVPSPNWAAAAELSIAALAELGRGSVTLSDADITLVAAEGTGQAEFDLIVGELDSALPQVFALHAVLPVEEAEDAVGPPEFTATLSPEGIVQLRGRVGDETTRDMVDSYARAMFGTEHVHTAPRIAPNLPADWPVRVLTGVEALSLLRNGALSVRPELVSLRGTSNFEDSGAAISRLLSDKLGEAQEFELSISYEPLPEPKDEALDPDICESRLAEAQAVGKIAFEPGSATIAAASADTMDRIAEILDECGDVRLEIQGHTDSQGREEMNQQLSQDRAQSVLDELRARQIPTTNFLAVGYGEGDPIADNQTETGREANRRIEFRLIRPAPVPETATALESLEMQAGAEDGAATATQDTEAAAEHPPGIEHPPAGTETE